MGRVCSTRVRVASPVAVFVVLLMAAAAVAVLGKLLPIPYVPALALIGALAGVVLHGPAPLHLTRSFILFVLLPGLLFEAGFNLDWRELRESLPPVLVLATVGVLLTAALIALIGRIVLGLPLPVAFLLGAVVAAPALCGSVGFDRTPGRNRMATPSMRLIAYVRELKPVR